MTALFMGRLVVALDMIDSLVGVGREELGFRIFEPLGYFEK